MRALGWSVVAALLVGVGGGGGGVLADGGKTKGDKDKDRDKGAVDISAFKDELVVLTDDDGVMYVLRPRAAGRDGGPVFVGDGKTFYEQRLTSGGMDGSKGTYSYGIWAPRIPGYDDASLWLNGDKKYFISCGQDKQTELRVVGAKETKRIVDTAAFRPALFDRLPHLIARDDTGTYYFVDMDFDGRAHDQASDEQRYRHGHRVFVGKKGAMKQLPMTNVVADSGGEIYQTKRGELQIITEDNKTATWVRGRKKTALKLLERADNRYLIYRELGIYGFIGTACEDL
jgi:hypothetical protein